MKSSGLRVSSLHPARPVAIAGLAAAEEPELTSSLQQQRCCFENPRFSGTCEVTPGPEESCSDVLAYLNNPKSVGKNYCGNTKVRGGWTQVACEDDAAATDQLRVARECSGEPDFRGSGPSCPSPATDSPASCRTEHRR
jgi:hypothetical protein